MLRLIGTDGSRFYSFTLEPGPHVLGRQPECAFCVPHKTVSREHARLEVGPDNSVAVQDLGSHNGTFVNGSSVTVRCPLKPGDVVAFGSTEFRIATESSPPPSTPLGSRARLTDLDPQRSMLVPIDEALRPLPQKVTDRPELLPTLFEMAKLLALPEPQEVLLEKSLHLISRVISAQRLAVLFVSEDQEEVYTAATLLPDGKDPGAFQLSRTIVREIMTQKNALVVCDAAQDPRFAQQQSIILSDLKSAVAVPLFDDDKVLGILYADTASPLHRFGDDHVRVLATFGNIIAAKLLSYQLLAERQERQIIDAELRRASAIQKRLLVETPPEVEGYRVCAFQEQSLSVGGDLYDIRRLRDGRLLFMVADVSGKGMGAALLMSNILASFRVLFESEEVSLCTAVKTVSQQVYRFSDPGDYATLFIGMLDPSDGRVRYVNAGHNPPLVARVDGGAEYLVATGIMIGAFDGIEWQEGTVDLNPGDLLLVFTDGVTEAEGENGQYGEKRMEKIVTANREVGPQDTVARLMEDIGAFVGNRPQSDDITMVCVRRTAL